MKLVVLFFLFLFFNNINAQNSFKKDISFKYNYIFFEGLKHKSLYNYNKAKEYYLDCVDLNKNMLEESKKKIKINNFNKIKFINANAEKLPMEENFFDKYIISFCLRNVTHIDLSLNEAYRILKPGGSFYCLEFSKPKTNLINLFYNKYKSKIIPIMGEKLANNKNAYKYLEESISLFPNQESLLNIMNSAGFKNTSYIDIFDGIVSIHKGYKI